MKNLFYRNNTQLLGWKTLLLAVFLLLLQGPQWAHANVDEQEKQALKILYGVGQYSYQLSNFSSNLAVEAAVMASRLTGGGQLITNGTLTQYAPDLESFTYSPTPADQLQVKFLNGETFSFTYQDLRGDLLSGASNFLARDHALHFIVKNAALIHIEVASLQWNGQRQGAIQGDVQYENLRYQLSLALEGTYHFDVDNNGSQYKTQFALHGSATSTTVEDLRLQVQESRTYEMATARWNGRMRASSYDITQINNGLERKVDGATHTYQFVDAGIKKAFRDGHPVEPEYWQGTGMLTKNGRPYGQIALSVESEQAVFSLNLPEHNDRIKLEAWTLSEGQ